MTAATSEYAMLDSMFAMDPVFPGLGNLDNLEPMSLDQQFIPNWDTNTTTTSNNDTNHTRNIQSQSHPVHPTFMSNNNSSNQNQGQDQTQIQNQNQNQIQGNTNQTTDIINSGGIDPGTPWSTWLQGTLQGQSTTAPMDDGSGKTTMSSSEVYKKVVKP